jgi:hypothetical protein
LDSQLQAFRDDVGAELEHASTSFHQLLDAMSADLRRQPSDGTKWSNDELLFHMMFGYMIVWSLIWLVKFFSRMPIKVSVIFAAILNVFTGPFNTANYLGSRVGARIYPHDRMGAKFDRVVKSLRRRLAAERDDSLRRQMCFPPRWDPFFKERMSLADVYRYPTQHFDFHRRQLSGGLGGGSGSDGNRG